MKLFIDTANVDEIREAASWGILDGVTTNPSLFAKTSSRDSRFWRIEVALTVFRCDELLHRRFENTSLKQRESLDSGSMTRVWWTIRSLRKRWPDAWRNSAAKYV